MNNNKETVLVQVALPTKIHRDLKVEALLKKEGNGRKIDLQSVMIDRLKRDLKSYPIQNILTQTA